MTRKDLCGGCRVTRIPTATSKTVIFMHFRTTLCLLPLRNFLGISLDNVDLSGYNPF